MRPLPPPRYDARPALWATGGIFGLAGLAMVVFDHSLVPLSHEFGLIPLGLGGAVGAALLRERYGPRLVWVYVLFMTWFAYAVVMDQTAFGIVFLAMGLFSLTRAVVQTAAAMEG